MKNTLTLIIVTAVALLSFPNKNLGQAPNLGTAADFAILSTAGAVTSSSSLLYLTHVTGNIGAAPASISGFGNVDGVLYQGGTEFANASTDINAAYAYLAGLTPTNVMATPFGGGTILTPGVHSIVNAAIWLTGDLILDAQNDPNAVFVFQLDGALNVSANSKVIIINGGQACNVFWMVNGAVTVDAGVTLQGTIITQAGAISMGAGDSLVGRAFAINAAISVNETTIYLPLGCGSPVLTGPALPALNSVECYAIFSSNGPVQDDFATFVIGDVGTNLGSTLGYDPLKVTGTIHPIPDGSTAQCATDLQVVYNDLNALPYDIELLEPSLFGHNLVLTPHTYLMLAAVQFTDSLYLNAQGNPDAVFIFQINGAFTTSTFSNVILINGAQAQNVYWKIDGAVDINDYSIFNGTIVSAGAINLFTGVVLNGRALTIVGALSTYAAEVNAPSGISGPAGIVMGPDTVCQGETGVIFSVGEISGATSYTWTLPSGATIISGANTDSITVDFSPTATSGTGNITVQGSSACGSGTISTNFEVEVLETPIIDSVNNQVICNNDTTTTVVFSGGPLGTVYNWTNDNTSIGLAATGSGDINSFTATDTGTATIAVTPTFGGCDGADSRFTITVVNCGSVDLSVVKTVNDLTPFIGTNIVFTIVAANIGSINATGVEVNDILQNGYTYISSTTTAGTYNSTSGVWTIGNINNGASETLTITATVNSTGNYVNTAMINGNEADGNSFNDVSVIETFPTDFFIPEGFSPNGDGINDVFVIRGIQYYPDNSIVIFNRWGNKVFETQSYKNTWDGKSTLGLRVGGNILPIGTYFYVLDLGDGSDVYKGTIYLNK